MASMEMVVWEKQPLRMYDSQGQVRSNVIVIIAKEKTYQSSITLLDHVIFELYTLLQVYIMNMVKQDEEYICVRGFYNS